MGQAKGGWCQSSVVGFDSDSVLPVWVVSIEGSEGGLMSIFAVGGWLVIGSSLVGWCTIACGRLKVSGC